MIYLLDASALIRYLAASPSLSPRVKDIIDDPGPGNQPAVATMALVEVWDVARKRRGEFIPLEFVVDAIQARNMVVEDLTLAVINRLPR